MNKLKQFIFALTLIVSPKLLFAQTNYYLQNKTLTYNEVINAYQQLDGKYLQAKMLEFGRTDGGKPLHLFLINSTGNFNS